MNTRFRQIEKRKQVNLYNLQKNNGAKGIFGDARNGGHWNKVKKKGGITKTISNYDFILKPEDSKYNLYSAIRENAMQYFDNHSISWWRQEEDGYSPTGHLLSSQIHCLNHLFALRTDPKAVKTIIDKATGMSFDNVLPSLIDDDLESFISFEFAFKNNEWLQETDEGAKRGTLCTSIDAMVMAELAGKKWLIPIEWKYTETYQGKDLTADKRLERYSHLIESSPHLKMPQDGIPHSVYFIEPSYELMRQTLLCEQLVKNGYADDFFHINVIPNGNMELRNAVENEFVPMLKDKSKFKIIDPQDLLSPLEENNLHPELIEYLKKRYWYR